MRREQFSINVSLTNSAGFFFKLLPEFLKSKLNLLNYGMPVINQIEDYYRKHLIYIFVLQYLAKLSTLRKKTIIDAKLYVLGCVM